MNVDPTDPSTFTLDEKVRYHSVKVDATDPSKFTLEMTVRVAFVPAEEGAAGQTTTNNVASRVLACETV